MNNILGSKVGNVFSKIHYKINQNIENNSQKLLAIDLLKTSVKRDLLTIVAAKLETQMLDTLDTNESKQNTFNVTSNVFRNIINNSAEDFLFNHYGVKVTIPQKCVKESLCVQAALSDFDILYKAPYETLKDAKSQPFRSFFSPIYNYASDDFIEALLDNLILEISNCVVFLITIDLSFLNELHKTLYKAQFLSLRSIERFKNNLTWQVRKKMSFIKPLDIYNNRYNIYIIQTSGIYSRAIYANRAKEVTNLSEIPLLTLTVVEVTDFLTSRVDEAVYLLGSGFRFTLTSVFGKIIGLVWRGIIEGLKK